MTFPFDLSSKRPAKLRADMLQNASCRPFHQRIIALAHFGSLPGAGKG
jgi:hypothetical protein